MSSNLVTSVSFNNLRIPYNDALADLGIDNIGWKVLQETVFPNATSLDSIVMALTYCKRRKLDVFKRPVHIVPMWSAATKGMIDTIWPAISELRTTAARTSEYAGKDATVFGPVVTATIGKKTLSFPDSAQVTVYRIVKGVRCAFVGPKVMWREAYARTKRDDDSPNDMWTRRPYGQIDKCAEGGALRVTFPEEIGNEYSAEEMDGQIIYAAAPALQPPIPPPALEAKDKPLEPPAPPTQSAFPLRDKLKAACARAVVNRSTEELEAAWSEIVMPHAQSLDKEQYEELSAIYQAAEKALEP